MTVIFYTRSGGAGTGHWAGATTELADRGPWLSVSGVGWSIGLLTWLLPFVNL